MFCFCTLNCLWWPFRINFTFFASAGVKVGGNGEPLLVESRGRFSMKGSKQLPVEQWLSVATWCHKLCYGVIWAWVPSLLLNSWTPALLLSPTAADHILNSGLALFLLIWLLFHSRHSHTQRCDLCCIIVKLEDETTHAKSNILTRQISQRHLWVIFSP